MSGVAMGSESCKFINLCHIRPTAKGKGLKPCLRVAQQIVHWCPCCLCLLDVNVKGWCRWLLDKGVGRHVHDASRPALNIHLSSPCARSERVTQHAQPCPGSMLIVSTLCPYTKIPLLSLQNLLQKLRSCYLTSFFSTVLGANSSTGRRPS